jgi:hypothetical protein
MQASVVAMLNIGYTIIPCTMVLGIKHVQDMHDHLIYDLILSIYLGVEGRGFDELGV